MFKFNKRETTGTHTTGVLKLDNNNQYVNSDITTDNIRIIEYDIISGIENTRDLDAFINNNFNDILEFLGNDKEIGVKINFPEFSLKTMFSKDVSEILLTKRLKRNFIAKTEFDASNTGDEKTI